MTWAYYNDSDEEKLAWCRELAKRGVITDGEFDQRSIHEVAADDLRKFRRCHFFCGIGVWDYALRLAGWPDDREVWTGSCPCPSFSCAGKGTADQGIRVRNFFPNTSLFWAMTFSCAYAILLVAGWAKSQQRVQIPFPVVARPQLVFVRRLRPYRYVFWQHPYTDQDGKHVGDDECWVADILHDIPEPFRTLKPRTMFAEFNYVNTEEGWSLDPNKSRSPLGLSAGYRLLRDDDFEPVLWTGEMPHTGKCKTQGGSE